MDKFVNPLFRNSAGSKFSGFAARVGCRRLDLMHDFSASREGYCILHLHLQNSQYDDLYLRYLFRVNMCGSGFDNEDSTVFILLEAL